MDCPSAFGLGGAFGAGGAFGRGGTFGADGAVGLGGAFGLGGTFGAGAFGNWRRGSRTETTGDHDAEGNNAYKVIKRNHLQQRWGRTGQYWHD